MFNAIALSKVVQLASLGFLKFPSFLPADRCRYLASEICDCVDSPALQGFITRHYGGSEIRLWSAQLYIKGLRPLYGELKSLSTKLFGFRGEFNMMAMVNHQCDPKFFKSRWHCDSLSRQKKFFLYLTDVDIVNGPFQFIPRSHRLLFRAASIVRSPHKNPYISLPSMKRVYSHMPDQSVESISPNYPIESFVCSAGDLLAADVRMIHRDSPTLDGLRVSLHCYLGVGVTSTPPWSLL